MWSKLLFILSHSHICWRDTFFLPSKKLNQHSVSQYIPAFCFVIHSGMVLASLRRTQAYSRISGNKYMCTPFTKTIRGNDTQILSCENVSLIQQLWCWFQNVHYSCFLVCENKVARVTKKRGADFMSYKTNKLKKKKCHVLRRACSLQWNEPRWHSHSGSAGLYPTFTVLCCLSSRKGREGPLTQRTK